MIEHTYHCTATLFNPDPGMPSTEEWDEVATTFELATQKAVKTWFQFTEFEEGDVGTISKIELMPDEDYIRLVFVGTVDDRSYGRWQRQLYRYDAAAPYTNVSNPDGGSLEPGDRIRVFMAHGVTPVDLKGQNQLIAALLEYLDG